MLSYTVLILWLRAKRAEKFEPFLCTSLSNHWFHKRRGDSSGVTLLMWKFYWGTSKSEHFEWGMCGFFVIFNGVIFSYKIPVGWVIYLVGWKNGPFLEIFFTGVTSGVDPTGSQRRGCPNEYKISKITSQTLEMTLP